MSINELQILESKVQKEVDEANKELQKDNMSVFLARTSMLTSHVDHHITKNCTFLMNLDEMDRCVKNANNIRVKYLNKIAELLVEKCGGKMIYLKE